ncbi:hypothetical protein BC831DRAFT_444535, partial [Entophlyctis helioformis]
MLAVDDWSAALRPESATRAAAQPACDGSMAGHEHLVSAASRLTTEESRGSIASSTSSAHSWLQSAIPSEATASTASATAVSSSSTTTTTTPHVAIAKRTSSLSLLSRDAAAAAATSSASPSQAVPTPASPATSLNNSASNFRSIWSTAASKPSRLAAQYDSMDHRRTHTSDLDSLYRTDEESGHDNARSGGSGSVGAHGGVDASTDEDEDDEDDEDDIVMIETETDIRQYSFASIQGDISELSYLAAAPAAERHHHYKDIDLVDDAGDAARHVAAQSAMHSGHPLRAAAERSARRDLFRETSRGAQSSHARHSTDIDGDAQDAVMRPRRLGHRRAGWWGVLLSALCMAGPAPMPTRRTTRRSDATLQAMY